MSKFFTYNYILYYYLATISIYFQNIDIFFLLSFPD